MIPCNLTTTQFKSLVELASKESIFVFNNKLYKQIDRTVVGFPVGLTLASIFLCFRKTRITTTRGIPAYISF